MVKVDEAIIARYAHGDLHFEILVDPKMVQEVRNGKKVSLNDLLASEVIFKNAKKGDKAADENVVKVFGTDNLEEVVYFIIKNGEVQLTTEERRDLVEEKKKQIIDYIATNAIDPRTGAPHPPARIEKALGEVKIRIDPFKKSEEQIDAVIHELRVLLPLKFEKVKVSIKVRADLYGKVINEIKNTGKILKDEWLSDGSWSTVVEIPGGLQTSFIDAINNKVHGACEIKIVK